MFQLLNPIWLSALAALSVPVIIHLWNQRPRHTLRVGSIALVPESAISVKRSLKLSQLLLLLLRCLFLAFAALALAAPIWKADSSNSQKGWVLIPPEDFAGAYRFFQPRVDSLLHAGFELHLLSDGFEQVSPGAILNRHDSSGGSSISYRRLVAVLDDILPHKIPVYIFSDNYLRHFSGPRNAVSLNLRWATYTPATVAQNPGRDQSSMNITILSKKAAMDGRWLSAVLKAVGDYTGRTLKLTVANNASDVKPGADWLFWLDEGEPGKDYNPMHLFQYAAGKSMDRSSYLIPGDSSLFAPIRLFQRIQAKKALNAAETVLWRDGFGDPLLTTIQSNGTDKFELYTRIDPAWNDLPLSDQFPQLIAQLIFPAKPEDRLGGASDTTTISQSQLMPVLRTGSATEKKLVQSRQIELDWIFWLAAALLFFLERLYSFYLPKKPSHG